MDMGQIVGDKQIKFRHRGAISLQMPRRRQREYWSREAKLKEKE